MYIVAIGASAGGLAALEDFFRNMPADTGMAFVVVQHLDPTRKALLAELLQRFTAMPVTEARNDMPVKPDCVYVIPPNSELRLEGNILKVEEPGEPRGQRLPVNVLFSSLASTHNEQAIAVVLSGMGSDGTLGLQAIKATGGLAVGQDPGSAQFDAMPKSAVASGCVDILAPAEEIPGRILAYVSQVPQAGAVPEAVSQQPLLEPIVRLLQHHTRHDFSLYKPSTLQRRIERRMAVHGIAELPDYTEYLKANKQEVLLLFRELLIGVTEFFRDSEVWDFLAESALPRLMSLRQSGEKLRAWVAGCSTGEEAYTLAMVFLEARDQAPESQQLSLQIFASDLSPEAIATARRGRYPRTIEKTISSERLVRFFTRHDDHYRVHSSIRDMVLFAQHDVILDPPFTRMDLVTCRNLLIYFDPMLQRRLLPLFHYSLRPDGLLLLGKSETIGKLTNLFQPIKPKLRIYRRKEHKNVGGTDFLLKSFPPLSTFPQERTLKAPDPSSQIPDNLQAEADRVLLQNYSPAAVVLNNNADIVYISGRTGKYLEPAAGKANWNIHAMARQGLRGTLYTALQQAETLREPLEIKDVQVQTGNGIQSISLSIQTFHEPAPLKDMTMVVFRDTPASTPGNGSKKRPSTPSSRDHEQQIEQYQQEIRRLQEEGRLTREELQATNEELQSANEELQSANEELTTSKEEMQSMNEELQTINTELQTKLDDLALAQSDMQNVLNSIEIAILFLDQHLNVRRYTSQATAIFSLRESDLGRPLTDLSTTLDYPELQNDAKKVLSTLDESEKQIITTDKRWFSVRIMAYRRLDDVIDGVVITLLDITETKGLESHLRKQSES